MILFLTEEGKQRVVDNKIRGFVKLKVLSNKDGDIVMQTTVADENGVELLLGSRVYLRQGWSLTLACLEMEFTVDGERTVPDPEGKEC